MVSTLVNCGIVYFLSNKYKESCKTYFGFNVLLLLFLGSCLHALYSDNIRAYISDNTTNDKLDHTKCF